MYEGKKLGRLATMIDCGTVKGFRKIYLGFQLADYKIKPKDETLPDYCIYAKSPYGGLISDFVNEENESILKALGYKEGDLIDYLYNNVGKLVMLNIVDNEYQGKTDPILSKDGHESYEGENPGVEWGTELKRFKVSDSMTIEEVNALGFENKHLKQSAEYIKLKQLKDVEPSEVDTLF